MIAKVPFSGPKNGFLFGPPTGFRLSVFPCAGKPQNTFTMAFGLQRSASQVSAFWKSIAFIADKYNHQTILWINLDETSIPHCPASPMGCVAREAFGHTRPKGPHMKLQKSRRRGAYTYVALICDNPAVQPLLPHFLISTKTRLPQKMCRAYHALPPTKLQLLRGESSWVTASCMVTMLKELKKALEPVVADMKPVLLLDCAMPHLPKIVMSCARKLGVQLLYIPSCSTSLIQPLDVYGFSAFKMFLRRKYLEQRVTALGGHPEPLAWLWQVSQSPREFFASKSWAHAFQGVGCARDVTLLQSDLREFMDNPMLFPPPVKPTLAEMALVWPQRRRMGYAAGMLF